jgi:SAM-dependent methyltransferase
MLDLVRMGPHRLPPPGGIELLRQIGRLTDMAPDHEVLSSACASGVGLQAWVEEFGVNGSGVETDPSLVALGEAWARDSGVLDRFHLQEGRSDDLPYRDGIFDVAVGELGMTAAADAGAALRELVRVTRPGGRVALIQLVWKAPVEEERQRLLAGHLGVRPLMLVEWKRLMREAGLVDIRSEDWSDEGTSFRPMVAKPFPDFTELFSFTEKLGILRRAFGQWGWRGPVTALIREARVHRLLTRERVLGLDLLLARLPEDAESETTTAPGSAGATAASASVPAGEPADAVRAPVDSAPESADTAREPAGPLASTPSDPAAADAEPSDAAAAEPPPLDDADGPTERPEVDGLPLFGGDS